MVDDDRYQAAIEAMGGSFWLFDAVKTEDGTVVDFRVADCNRVSETRIGQSRSQLVGELHSVLFPYSVGRETFVRMRDACVTGVPFDADLPVEIAGLPITHMRLKIVPFATGVALVSDDLSEHRRLEQEATLFAAVVPNLAEGLCVTRASDATIVYTNPKYCRMHGYEPGELVGQPFTITANNLQRAASAASDVFGQLLQTGEASFEAQSKCKDGTLIATQSTVSISRNTEYGDVYVTVSSDVSQRKRLEEERDGFFVLALDMLCIAGFDGQFKRLNPAWSEQLGWSVDELTAKPFLEFVHPDDQARTIRETERLSEGQTTLAFENRYVHKNGSYRHLSWRAVASRAHDVIFASARDITDLRRGEEVLRAANAEKEILLKEIHHRVKNNLQVVSSLLKLHAEQIESPAARAALQDSRDRVRTIGLLHEKLYQAENFGSVAMGEYVESLVATLQRMHPSAGAPRCAVSARGIHLALDLAVPCGLILNELLTNALKHAFVGASSAGTIGVSMRDIEGMVELVVEDDGRGMPAALDSKAPATLGMHLIRTLTRQLRGVISFETNAGTRATLRFPRDDDSLT